MERLFVFVYLPGETVAFENGHVLIHGEVLDEPYEKRPCDWNCPPVKLGPDEPVREMNRLLPDRERQPLQKILP